MTTTAEWLTVAEACRYLRVTRATIYRWARQGKLRLYRLGARGTRLRAVEVEHLISPLEDENEQRAWLKLADSSFVKDWDNEKDAIYDNWRELYGVRDR